MSPAGARRRKVVFGLIGVGVLVLCGFGAWYLWLLIGQKAPAEKRQVAMMVRMLLPASTASTSDAADALAVAICHAQHRAARSRGAA